MTSPTLAWVLTIPLLAFFYLGSSASLRMIVIGMFVVNLAIFCGFYFYGYHPITDNLPREAMQGLGLISTVAAALYVTMMALYYAKIQTVAGRTRERDASAHGDGVGASSGDRRSRASRRGKGRISGEDEPRIAHAAECGHRLQPDSPGGCARRRRHRIDRGSWQDPRRRPASAQACQRDPRPVENRGRKNGTRPAGNLAWPTCSTKSSPRRSPWPGKMEIRFSAGSTRVSAVPCAMPENSEDMRSAN